MDIEERRVADLTVRIDRLICVGFETCVDLAPDLFRMDSGGIATFAERTEGVARERVLEACRACPVDALQVFDDSGAQLVP
jgi:ferredoxin